MARVLGPAVSQRYTGGTTAVIYTDAGGTQLADIHSYPAGTVVAGSSLTIDAAGYMPRFYFPEGSRAVWYRLDGGAPVALTPDTEDDDDLGGLGSDLSPRTHAHGLQALFGAGTDGVIAFDGVTAYAGFSALVGTTYTLSRDVYGTDITVSAGVDVVTNGFRLNASGTLTIAATGVVHHDGGAAAAAVAGAAAAAGTLSASGAGGAGGAGGGAGAAGTAVAASAFGGAGGAGGAATAGGAGGAGGTVTVPTVAMGGLLTARVLPSAIVGSALTVGTARPMAPGAGGGGGGADAANAGGGGGGGGGVVLVNARLLVNGGQIMAAGGAGAAGTAGNAGGGAGGGGGLVIVNTTNSSGAGTVTAPGGALGAGAGTGAAGAAGTAGTAVTNIWA